MRDFLLTYILNGYGFNFEYLDLYNLDVTFWVEFPTLYLTEWITEFLAERLDIEVVNLGFELRIIGWLWDGHFALIEGEVVASFFSGLMWSGGAGHIND